jgi:two-component system nitrate/nitrite response regulator NarL
MSTGSDKVRVLVVDDHTLFRRGLIALLGQDPRFDITGEASDMGEALRCLGVATPEVILLDIHMPGVRGIEGIASLREIAPAVKIMMLTVSENEDDLIDALRSGADGYLLKTTDADQLADSIVKVVMGDSVVSPEMTSKLVAALRQPRVAPQPPGDGQAAPAVPAEAPASSGMVDDLSVREMEILRLIARGDSNKLIARKLDIAETTVKIHVQHILRKLDVSSRVQAAVYAVHSGIH